jgi:integrase
MPDTHSRLGEIRRVGENLYRYSSGGVYYARFRQRGKEIRRSLRTTDRESAKRRLQEHIEKASKIDSKSGKMSLRELVRLHEESLAQFAPRTVASRRSILKQFKETWPHGLDIPLSTISSGQLALWLGSRSAKLKNATYNEYARFLRQMFDLAVNLRAIADSPAATLRGLKVESPIRLTPSWEQFQSIVNHIRSQKLNAQSADSADLVEFMGLTGVGKAECANLKGHHIDFAAGRITLYRMKTDTGFSLPIFPQLLPLLRRFESAGHIKASEPVFRVREPKKSLASACKAMHYPHFSPRSLRRCFITRAVELGIDFKTIAAWQGHRDGGVLVARTYSHLRSEHTDAMARRLQTVAPAWAALGSSVARCSLTPAPTRC